MKALNLMWLAGLLEGEGCFTWCRTKNRYGVPVVYLKMTDEDIVVRVASLIKAKSVSKIKVYSDKHTPGRMCKITGQPVYEMMALLLPYMGIRRSVRIQELMEKWSIRPSYKASDPRRDASTGRYGVVV